MVIQQHDLVSKKLLVVVPKSAGQRSQFEIARKLSEADQRVALWLSFAEASMNETAANEVSSRDWNVFFEEDFEDFEPIAMSPEQRDAVSKVEQSLSKRSAGLLHILLETYRKKLSAVDAIFTAHRPEAVLIASDGIAADPFIIGVAKRLKIPVICCPFGYSSEYDLEKELEQKRSNARSHDVDKPGGDVVKKLFPKWVKQGRCAGDLMYRPEIILAREALGLSVENPWRTYGSDADVMCAPSRQYRDHLVEQGFDPARISVVGSISGQRVWDQLEKDALARDAFRQPRKIEPNRTRVLLSMPPSYHRDRAHLTEQPKSYSALVAAVTKALRKHRSVELTVSVHPSIAEEDLSAYSDLGIEVAPGDVVDAIPKNDIYVTDYSSTVRWAISCGKPVVNYDFYKFKLDAYTEAPGVLTMEKYSDYEKTVSKLVMDDRFFRKQAERQIECADDWGLIDGAFVANLLNVIDGSASGR